MGDDLYLVTHDVKNTPTHTDTALAMISTSAGKVQKYRALTVPWPNNIGSNDLESLCVVPGSPDTSRAPARMEILAAESGYVVLQSGESSVTYGGRIFHLSVVFDRAAFDASVVFRREYPLPIRNGINIIGGASGDNFEGMTCVANDAGELLVVLGERGGVQNEGTPRESSRRGSLHYTVFDLNAGTMGQWEFAYDSAG